MLWGSGCRGEKLLPIDTRQDAGFLHKKGPPRQNCNGGEGRIYKTQITFCSIHLPRTKRTQKNSERMAQSRNMPIQMNSRPQWNLSTIR